MTITTGVLAVIGAVTVYKFVINKIVDVTVKTVETRLREKKRRNGTENNEQ